MNVINELDSTCGIPDDELERRFKAAIKIANEISLIKGNPIARYDSIAKKTFLEYPDGHKEYTET